MYSQWKQGQVTWEDYRVDVRHCREEIRTAKAQLELKLASTVKDKKGCFKYVNSKRQARNNIGLLLDTHSHLTNRDIDKAETFNAFFATVFNTDDGLWGSQSPGPENHDCENDKLNQPQTCVGFAAPAGSLEVYGARQDSSEGT